MTTIQAICFGFGTGWASGIFPYGFPVRTTTGARSERGIEVSEHILLERAERGYSMATKCHGQYHQIAAIILAGFIDGYSAGIQAASDWLRARECMPEAEALENSIKQVRE